MATFQEASIQQGTYETRKWTVDFTPDLPSAVTVTAGTAYHTPPSGAAGTPTVSVSSPYVSAQIGGLTVTGVHYLDVVGTFSNAEVSQVRIAFTVNYPATACRAGMVDLVSTLRQYTDAGLNDFAIAGHPYWTDAQLQTILDRTRKDISDLEVEPLAFMSNGTTDWRDYYLPVQNMESGTVLQVKDTTGAAYGTAAYTFDPARGVITWGSNTLGSTILVCGRTYDVNRAAAEVWRFKAANSAKMYDFSTDNHRLSRSQFYKNCMEMAGYYSALAGPSIITMVRGDLEAYDLD